MKLVSVVPPRLLLLVFLLMLAIAVALGLADTAFAGGDSWAG